MIRTIIYTLLSLLLLSGCDKKEDANPPLTCKDDNALQTITQRHFKMGFSTWPFGPDVADKDETYEFLETNADIYSEQIEHKIPWSAWINNTALPTAFVNDIDSRVAKRLDHHKLLLSVSLLNIGRTDLLEDYDGSIPNYTALNDTVIENAYFKHLNYLISRFNPDYLVVAMEVNELLVRSASKWTAYKLLMRNIRSRLKNAYPNLPLSESVTLHNWFKPEVANPTDFIAEISNYVNQNIDFAAISYYPFLKGQHTKTEFQQAFDFLHTEVSIPMAFVETAHIAEDLHINGFNLNIAGDVCEQKYYLETLLLNAHHQNYEFIIWWAHRDYDKLWAIFPPEYQDLGKLWKDTGLLDENGTARPAFTVWKNVLEK